MLGRCHAGRTGEEVPDADGVGGVVGALVDDLEHVVATDDRGRDLDATGAPTVGQRHFAAAEGHLIAGDRDRLEDGAADHPLGLLVEIGEVIARQGRFRRRHESSSLCFLRRVSARRLRTVPSSPWKST